MSGPKDFAVIFAAARLIEIQARRASERAERRAAAEARRAEQRRRAEQKMAEMAAKRAAAQAEARRRGLATQAELAERREQAARRTALRLAKIQQAARRRPASTGASDGVMPGTTGEDQLISSAEPDASQPSSIETSATEAYSTINGLNSLADDQAQQAAALLSESLDAMAELDEVDADLTARIEQIRESANAELAAALDRANRVPDLIQQVVSWQDELQRDEAVIQFRGELADAWQSEARTVLEQHESGHAIDAVMKKCEDLLARAEQLRKEAEDTQAAYATRNELLSDVIASLQEIGFFVSDPQFESPNDPAGPVSIKATRGNEEVSASIDLSDTVRSTWDGMAGEHCKDAFFDYVDQMQARGIEVKPTRADLQDRPVLKQKGARSLPQSDVKRRSK